MKTNCLSVTFGIQRYLKVVFSCYVSIKNVLIFQVVFFCSMIGSFRNNPGLRYNGFFIPFIEFSNNTGYSLTYFFS